MTLKKIHRDWPEFDTAKESFDLPEPVGDLAYALEERPRVATATAPSVPTEGFQLAEIAHIERYYVQYHGSVWTPESSDGGTELTMHLVGQLVDGRWFSVDAWNDYTGWGCQDSSDVRIGETEAQVVEFGLDKAACKLLGYPEPEN